MQPGRLSGPGHVQGGRPHAAAGGNCSARMEGAGDGTQAPCLDYGSAYMATNRLANSISDSWPVTTSPHTTQRPLSSFYISQPQDSPPFPGPSHLGGYTDRCWNMAYPGMAAWPPSVKSEDTSGEDSQHSPQQDYYFNSTYPDHLFPHTAQSPHGDEERTKRRREQNKMAAQRCRQRRRHHIDELVKELQDLECDNTSLTYEIHQLRKEKSNLEMTLGQHAPSCQQRTMQLPATTTEVNELIISGQ